ncbi:hypothetical protein H5410_001105 [Solanum commersonii]|uniref:Uncharacterized protein n=1 Tax=Solanum commersonii TaxID=4109 RepID=A0A9J6AY65_SOLCO|nr:hypothetical protein H5410_001105 [Solanum commersonii]
MSTLSLVNIRETSPLNPQSPFDHNNPTPSQQPGPYFDMLFDNLFKGDLPENKIYESNILAANENLGIESLTLMMEEHKSPILHEEEVREFYYIIEFVEDGSINSRVRDKSLYLDKDLLGEILEVPKGGIRSVVGKTCTMEFVKECSKIPNTRFVVVLKKLMK